VHNTLDPRLQEMRCWLLLFSVYSWYCDRLSIYNCVTAYRPYQPFVCQRLSVIQRNIVYIAWYISPANQTPFVCVSSPTVS